MVVHAPHQAARHQRRGTLLPQSFKLVVASRLRRPRGSWFASLIPPDGGTHALHIADASPPNTQTDGRHGARAVLHPHSIGTVHPRRADGPCEDAYSIRSRHSHRWERKTADRQEGRGCACLCVVRLSHRSRGQGLRACRRHVLASVCHTALTAARAVWRRPSTQAIPPGTIRRE